MSSKKKKMDPFEGKSKQERDEYLLKHAQGQGYNEQEILNALGSGAYDDTQEIFADFIGTPPEGEFDGDELDREVAQERAAEKKDQDIDLSNLSEKFDDANLVIEDRAPDEEAALDENIFSPAHKFAVLGALEMLKKEEMIQNNALQVRRVEFLSRELEAKTMLMPHEASQEEAKELERKVQEAQYITRETYTYLHSKDTLKKNILDVAKRVYAGLDDLMAIAPISLEERVAIRMNAEGIVNLVQDTGLHKDSAEMHSFFEHYHILDKFASSYEDKSNAMYKETGKVTINRIAKQNKEDINSFLEVAQLGSSIQSKYTAIEDAKRKIASKMNGPEVRNEYGFTEFVFHDAVGDKGIKKDFAKIRKEYQQMQQEMKEPLRKGVAQIYDFFVKSVRENKESINYFEDVSLGLMIHTKIPEVTGSLARIGIEMPVFSSANADDEQTYYWASAAPLVHHIMNKELKKKHLSDGAVLDYLSFMHKFLSNVGVYYPELKKEYSKLCGAYVEIANRMEAYQIPLAILDEIKGIPFEFGKVFDRLDEVKKTYQLYYNNPKMNGEPEVPIAYALINDLGTGLQFLADAVTIEASFLGADKKLLKHYIEKVQQVEVERFTEFAEGYSIFIPENNKEEYNKKVAAVLDAMQQRSGECYKALMKAPEIHPTTLEEISAMITQAPSEASGEIIGEAFSNLGNYLEYSVNELRKVGQNLGYWQTLLKSDKLNGIEGRDQDLLGSLVDHTSAVTKLRENVVSFMNSMSRIYEITASEHVEDKDSYILVALENGKQVQSDIESMTWASSQCLQSVLTELDLIKDKKPAALKQLLEDEVGLAKDLEEYMNSIVRKVGETEGLRPEYRKEVEGVLIDIMNKSATWNYTLDRLIKTVEERDKSYSKESSFNSFYDVTDFVQLRFIETFKNIFFGLPTGVSLRDECDNILEVEKHLKGHYGDDKAISTIVKVAKMYPDNKEISEFSCELYDKYFYTFIKMGQHLNNAKNKKIDEKIREQVDARTGGSLHDAWEICAMAYQMSYDTFAKAEATLTDEYTDRERLTDFLVTINGYNEEVIQKEYGEEDSIARSLTTIAKYLTGFVGSKKRMSLALSKDLNRIEHAAATLMGQGGYDIRRYGDLLKYELEANYLETRLLPYDIIGQGVDGLLANDVGIVADKVKEQDECRVASQLQLEVIKQHAERANEKLVKEMYQAVLKPEKGEIESRSKKILRALDEYKKRMDGLRTHVKNARNSVLQQKHNTLREQVMRCEEYMGGMKDLVVEKAVGQYESPYRFIEKRVEYYEDIMRRIKMMPKLVQKNKEKGEVDKLDRSNAALKMLEIYNPRIEHESWLTQYAMSIMDGGETERKNPRGFVTSHPETKEMHVVGFTSNYKLNVLYRDPVSYQWSKVTEEGLQELSAEQIVKYVTGQVLPAELCTKAPEWKRIEEQLTKRADAFHTKMKRYMGEVAIQGSNKYGQRVRIKDKPKSMNHCSYNPNQEVSWQLRGKVIREDKEAGKLYEMPLDNNAGEGHRLSYQEVHDYVADGVLEKKYLGKKAKKYYCLGDVNEDKK